MLVLGAARKIPIYSAAPETTQVEVELISFLRDYLAPRETMHGVLVNVYGSGLLITGESGVGKSETAIELVKRGHNWWRTTWWTSAACPTTAWWANRRNWCGTSWRSAAVGIIDIATMYGVGAVIRSKTIDLEVKLENWRQGKEYDRLAWPISTTKSSG